MSERFRRGRDDKPLQVGDRVQLTRPVGAAAVGTEGVVVGFYRRDVETVLVKLVGVDLLVEVLPDELRKRA
jgi:hypothetical protein